MNTKLDIFLDIKNEENQSIKQLERDLSLKNHQNVKFTFVQETEGKFEFYVKGSSRRKIDEALLELGFSKSSKEYENL